MLRGRIWITWQTKHQRALVTGSVVGLLLASRQRSRLAAFQQRDGNLDRQVQQHHRTASLYRSIHLDKYPEKNTQVNNAQPSERTINKHEVRDMRLNVRIVETCEQISD